jgi:hypothetical protein
MRVITISNLLVFAVLSGSPTLLPSEKPENVIVPALPLLVTRTTQLPSYDAIAKVNMPPFVKVWIGPLPQSMLVVPLDAVPLE